ncbi:MAG TPA: type II secretion system protein [Candidatus Microsaccharimonas sp.]|jgi:prepilin-type N-terminal cleavage/methylation domain-containing protein
MGIHSTASFRKDSRRGFTIIETMLVLAVTGVLIATLLVGIGASINTQRYKDSVVSLKSLLQSQYSMASDVSNARSKNWTCSSSATPVPNAIGTAVGQSDCVLLGRYISIVGGDVSSAAIVGYENSTASAPNDVAEINNNYTLGVSTDSIDSSTLEWGSAIAWPASGAGSKSPTTPRSIAILVIRSPSSGTSYTFTSDTVYDITTITSAALKTMMVVNTGAVPGQQQRTLCVDPNGVTVPEKIAVYIGQAASDSSAIETRTNATIQSLGGDTKC